MQMTRGGWDSKKKELSTGSTWDVTGPNYSSDQAQPNQDNQVRESEEDNQPKG